MGGSNLFAQNLAKRRRSSRAGCSLTASKRPLSRLVGLPAGGSVRPLSPLPSEVAVLFARFSESYPPLSREVGGVVIYRCRGHLTGRIHIITRVSGRNSHGQRFSFQGRHKRRLLSPPTPLGRPTTAGVQVQYRVYVPLCLNYGLSVAPWFSRRP